MALVKCHECGAQVSTEAKACPGCGAKPQRPTIGFVLRNLSWSESFGLVVMLALSFWGIRACTTNGDEAVRPVVANEAKPAAVNFDLPLVTNAAALVCPYSVLDDKREGRGWQAALKSRVEVFGRHEDAVKAGCDEWREGQAIRLSDVEIQSAKELQAEHNCGMLGFDAGVVFSCDVRNATNLLTGSPVAQPPSPAKPTATADTLPPAAVVSELSEAERPLPLRLQEDQPATLVGTYAAGSFEDCCEAGLSKPRAYGSIRLEHSIALRDLGPNARAANENLIGYVELGGLSETQRATVGDGRRISVSCSSLYVGDTGHYALGAYCKDAKVTPL